MKDKVILIGFAACYKSSAGRRLAKILNYGFADTDRLIEDRICMSVSRFLTERGERAFREEESKILRSVASMTKTVISCGGGSVLSPSFDELARGGEVVWLTASASVIYERLNGNTRPLFDGMTVKELEEKLAERNAIYKRYASLCISTDRRTSRSVAAEIAEALQK